MNGDASQWIDALPSWCLICRYFDTRERPDGITGTFMADLVLQILSYVAQLERENIKQRQAEGIASARLRGVRFGRPALERPDSYNDVIKAFEGGEVTRRGRNAPERQRIDVRSLETGGHELI